MDLESKLNELSQTIIAMVFHIKVKLIEYDSGFQGMWGAGVRGW